jgi:hypothetical protein
MIVAAQLVEVPLIPYYHAFPYEPFPEKFMQEARRLTANTLSNVRPLSKPLQHVVRLLHQLGVAYARRAPGEKVDPYVIRPLYDAQYALLQILHTHKATGNLSDMENLLAHTFQLYFETGPRGLPPEGKLCGLFLSRIIEALLPLLIETESEDIQNTLGLRPGNSVTENHLPRALDYSQSMDNVLTWSLSLATIAAAAQKRPDLPWLKRHLRSHLRATGLDQNQDEYCRILGMFPTTACFARIDLTASVQNSKF